MEKSFERAWAMMPEAADEKVANARFVPVFFENGDFACKMEALGPDGKTWDFLRFDGQTGVRHPLFDQEALAAALEKETGAPQKPDRLELELVKAREEYIELTAGKGRYRWADGKLAAVETDGLAISPDGRLAVLIRENNLWLKNMADGTLRQLTTDGRPWYDYASKLEGDTAFVADKLAGRVHKPNVLWSPDSRRFATYRLDQREIPCMHLLQSCPGEAGERPVLHSYRYALPEDAAAPTADLWLYTVGDDALRPVDVPAISCTFLLPIDVPSNMMAWSDTGKCLVTYSISRDHRSVSVYRVDPETGKSRRLFTEETDTFLFFHYYFMMQNAMPECPGDSFAPFWFFDREDELLWPSQRDGHYHLYAYDGTTGQLRRQMTRGGFEVCRLHRIDREAGALYASVLGLQDDPYDRSLVRIPLEGGEPHVLSAGSGNHLISFAPVGRRYVDVLTESDLPPVASLRDLEGREIARLAACDISPLEKTGYIKPIRFTATAADGQTPLYGILLLPEVPAGQKVPLLEYYYGGVQTTNVPHTFLSVLNLWSLESCVQLGMAVMVVDGMGTPLRGKAFHDPCNKNLACCAGLEDHVAVIRQLCERYPQLDESRVGVWGLSGGGYAAFHCITKHPEVYKCAVSAAGNHVQEIYIGGWSEQFMGSYDAALWKAQSAESLADRLVGKLLLAHGDLDDNVHPANTMRIVDALIKADKDFELLLMPNLHHNLHPSRYFRRRVMEFFVKNLIDAR